MSERFCLRWRKQVLKGGHHPVLGEAQLMSYVSPCFLSERVESNGRIASRGSLAGTALGRFGPTFRPWVVVADLPGPVRRPDVFVRTTSGIAQRLSKQGYRRWSIDVADNRATTHAERQPKTLLGLEAQTHTFSPLPVLHLHYKHSFVRSKHFMLVLQYSG